MLFIWSKSRYFVTKFREMQEEKVYIYELEGGEVNILNAENDTVKLNKTGMFLCKEGEVTLSIDDTEYHMERHSIIIYFSYSTLHIISHSPDLDYQPLRGAPANRCSLRDRMEYNAYPPFRHASLSAYS